MGSEAFGELYDRYCDRIYAFAYSRLNSRADAEDAYSEVFLRHRRSLPPPAADGFPG